jgi:polyhydroxybutyrate depolymerase
MALSIFFRASFGILLACGAICALQGCSSMNTSGWPGEPQALDFDVNLKSGSADRYALLHLPESFHQLPSNTTKQIPVVFSFHPMGLSPTQGIVPGFAWRQIANFDDLANQEDFAVVYPQGLTPAWLLHDVVPGLPPWFQLTGGYTWNSGGCCPGATSEEVDDVQFAQDLLSHLKKEIPRLSGGRLTVDPKRVYATGGSNGGFLSFRLACEVPDLFAAIAPATAVIANQTGFMKTKFGTWPVDPFNCESRERPVPTLLTVGTLDPLVPMFGNPALGFRSNEDNLGLMKRLNGIPEDSSGQTSYKKGRVTCKSYGGEANNVTQCVVDNMGHYWPTKTRTCKALVFMPGVWCSTDMDLTTEVWNFFKRHHLKD